MPKVSVVIPVYKVEKYLSNCLDSVVNQTLDDYEIIIVNNGASEKEREIISKYTSNPKVRVINFEENQGYGKALNTGIDSAEGEYIGIVESDDFIKPEMFEKMYNLAESVNADIAKCSFISFEDNGTIISLNKYNIPNETPFEAKEFPQLFALHPSIWSCIYKNDFLKTNNIKLIEEKETGWVDNPFNVECLCKAQSIIYTSEDYYYYRVNQTQSSSNLIEGIKTPYEASLKMQEVLNKLSVKDEAILKNVACREFSYIKIILTRMSMNNIHLAEAAINGLFELIGNHLDDNKKFIRLKKFAHNKNLKMYIIWRNIANFIANLISIRIMHKKLELKIFNHYITRRSSI